MDKLGRPRGLVRYDSLNGLAGKARRIIRPRLFAYLALLLLGAGVMTVAASRLKPGSMSLVRMTGAPYVVDHEGVRNQFMVRLINKRNEPVTYTLSIASEAPGMELAGFDEPLTLAPMAEEQRPLVLRQPRANYTGEANVTLKVLGEPGSFELTREVHFLGPDPKYISATPAAEAPAPSPAPATPSAPATPAGP
jgi:hypothetical protein